jgi:glutamine amidotransferase
MIAIIDYGMGNLRSVQKAFEFLGSDAKITSEISDLKRASHIVLPGVGAFADAAASLKASGFRDAISIEIERGKPFLGICLGYQMLFETSEEHSGDLPDVPGLGIFKGRVKKFPSGMGLKIPHMGWNSLSFPKPCALFDGLTKSLYVYFVHSYYVDAMDKSLVAAESDYGFSFDAAISQDNVFAVQFHPEKSGDAGLTIIKNFLKVVF